MTLVDDLEAALHSTVISRMPQGVQTALRSLSLSDLLLAYGNWRSRLIQAIPRKVHYSGELKSSAEYRSHRVAVEEIAQKLRDGDDITPHLSKRITTAYESPLMRSQQLKKRKDLDLLISEWGIHHLHLSTKLGGDGFVARTGDLLFAAFNRSNAYLIAIYPHQAWHHIGMLEVVARNWPKDGLLNKSHGSVGLADAPSDAERKQLRESGVTTLVEIDGAVYAPLGQTTAGTPMRVTMRVNEIMHQIATLRDDFNVDPAWLDVSTTATKPVWQPRVEDDEFGFYETTSGEFVVCGSTDFGP